MPELNLKQITDKLNTEFASEVRKLIFWYDANAEFASDIDTLELDNAKVLRLERDNQFKTKHFLEREDKTTNYLVYAPFAKPTLRENHLADTIRYSKEFFADRASLLALDLGINEKYKPVLQHYIKFFAAKERTQRFYELEIENFNKSVIETALMSVLCKTKIVSFEEIVRNIITDDNIDENKYLVEFERYDLLTPFWKMCQEHFGYTDAKPTLSKLVYTMFATYMTKIVTVELPQSLKNYCSYKSGNIIAFLDSLMNSLIYKDSYDRLANMTYASLKIEDVLSKMSEDSFAKLELFSKVDSFILKWLVRRLEGEDVTAKLAGQSIPELCTARQKMHFGSNFSSHYYCLENAYHLIMAAQFEPKKTAEDIWKSYVDRDYVIDQKYRYFYYHYDKVQNNSPFETLRTLVENIYTNRYLDPLCVAWSRAYADSKTNTGLIRQQDFYNKFIRSAKERTIVIISDALRYEVGQSLFKRLLDDEKCTASITSMQSVLPSYTRFGMSALLPHKSLEMSEDFRVFVDSKVCDDSKSRESILQSYKKESKVSQFDDLSSRNAIRELTTGQEVVYVYHNQIDARGDKLPTENEVFAACEEAIDEIHKMILRMTQNNNTRFVITSDHGFVYKRDVLAESDKIGGLNKQNAFIGKRYVIADEKVNAEGIACVTLGDVLSNEDERFISAPIGSDIFKVQGGGSNYVHGGMSLQELIVPVIEVKTNKAYTETKTAGIALVSIVSKITNLTTNLDFIQTDPVSDIVKETNYKLFFISDDDEIISGDNIYVADKKDTDASKRVFRLKFNFKNKQYDRNKKYYLIARDEKSGLEVIRHEVQMDLAFSDDFGFNI